jgi:hypothetical protein
VTPEVHRAQVIDLMDALKQSLAKRAGKAEAGRQEPAPATAIAKKPPVKAAKRTTPQEKVEKKAQAGKK